MIRSVCRALISLAILGSGLRTGAKDIPLTVDSQRVLRNDADRWIGININYVRDHDANHPQGRKLDDALKDLGVRWLRYPGGEKSNWYLWSNPPYERPEPVSLGNYVKYAGRRMDFDEYIACARAVGAEPYVVVGYNQQRTKEQWLENAVSWVRYSNQVRKYGVKYWEIGNEIWRGAERIAGLAADVPTHLAEVLDDMHAKHRFLAQSLGGRCDLQSLVEVGTKILGCLDPDRHSHQTLGHCRALELGLRHTVVRRPVRRGDQGFDPTEIVPITELLVVSITETLPLKDSWAT